MAHLVTQEIFELKPLIKSIEIKLSTLSRSGVKQILALITSDNEVVLYYCYGELPPVIKRIPWITDSSKNIQAVCFDSTATWLLIVCLDSSLYIVPALHIVDKKQKVDCKWSLNDITHFPKHPHASNAIPTSCVWWQTLECNQNALVGFDNGSILLISLTDGRCLGSCGIREPVKELFVCQDNSKETVSLLINSDSEHQWRLVLEHHSTGYMWPSDAYNQLDDSMRSRFYSLKQLGVDKLSSLRQRLAEARGARKDSQSDTASESSHSESNQSVSNQSTQSVHSGPELLPYLVDTFFAPQYSRKRYLFSALYKPTGLLTIHAADIESAPLYVHKLMPNTNFLILTDNLIYTLNNENAISIISCQLSESRVEGDSEFNDDSLVAQFFIQDEEILEIFKVIDVTIDVTPHKSHKENKFLHGSKHVRDISYLKPAIDTCIVVTNKSVYKIVVRNSPIQKFIKSVTEDNNLEEAEKLSHVFNLNLQQLLEHCGDIMISRGSYHSGIIIYKQAKVHLLKRVLKLAVSADCKTLLKFVHLCLSASRIDMNITTRIHIGNVAVMAYTELLLRSNEQTKAMNTKDFMNFLCHESHYDPILAVNIACQAGHWNIVNLLSKSRGLQMEAVMAFGKIIQAEHAPKPSNVEFLYALSEPTLTQSLLIVPQSSQVIFHYIRENVDNFPIEILKRLTVQLDPSQPCAIPLVNSIFKNNKFSSSMDTNMESNDFDSSDSCSVTIKDLVETFLYVILCMTVKNNKISFDLSLLENVPEKKCEEADIIKRFPDLKMLSCGFEHAAVIRNTCVYTMGVATSGCLGVGPLLTNTSGPRLVNTLHELKVTALSVSCGKKHTLCATDCGVYAWGSNTYGQLGLGPHLQETPYPQIVTTLSALKVIDIAAGQYHSVALTAAGQVYTWGWGIHGQLGHGCCDNEFYPKLLKFDQLVRQVTAGHAHTIILTCEGKLFGFGSNVFAQLETCNIESKKSNKPIWVVIMPDMYTPVEKVSSAYFHNVALTADQKVFTWGASPEEVRIFQSRSNQKQNGGSLGNQPESWKSNVQIYSTTNRRAIKQLAVGYRHTAILDNGRILWGRNKDEELSQPNLRDQAQFEGVLSQKFWHVSCGVDYTMAIDHTGQVLAWGTPSMIETILGVTMDIIRKKQSDEKMVYFKGTRRMLKVANAGPTSNNFPVEISVLPSTAFTFNQPNHKLLLSNKFTPYFVLSADNNDMNSILNVCRKERQDFQHIYQIPDVNIGQKTLHYTLETFVDFYDVETILNKCINLGNYQAASKVSFLHGHFVDSLGFILTAFKRHMEKLDINIRSLFTCKDSYDVKEKDQGVELIIKCIKDGLDSSSSSTPARILSSSSSLDSLRQFTDEGGRESPCDAGDIRQNVTNYVQLLKKSESSQLNFQKTSDKNITKNTLTAQQLQIKNKTAKDIIDTASQIVQFYIRKIYASENHILMQNVLLKCIEFWLSHNFPVEVLEDILLKNLDKYFYPLSILLFCKNFDSDDDEVSKSDDVEQISSSGFLKEFSTKFCLHLCSMVLESANKS